MASGDYDYSLAHSHHILNECVRVLTFTFLGKTLMNSVQTHWAVKIKGDVIVCVQPTIQQMSSYILLEQEDWFEDEMDFIRAYITSDMNAFDIGANHGVYGLSIAKKLTTGHVWAFEPTLSPSSMLAKSIELNQFSEKLTLVQAGLSDHPHDAVIFTSANSELNSLYGESGVREPIRLEALDDFLDKQAINVSIDFVKLDAEGEEIKILHGGRTFFSEQSPLIMFELKHGNVVNHGLIETIQALGYQIYRLLPDMNILVEYDSTFQDGFLLNLFACKTNRSANLMARGLLASNSDITKLSAQLTYKPDWFHHLQAHPFTQSCIASWQQSLRDIPNDYLSALSACLLAHDTTLAAAHRVALVESASGLIDGMTKNDASVHPAIGLLKVHLAHLRGYRHESIELANSLLQFFVSTKTESSWPFLPPCPLFFTRQPKQSMNAWITTVLQEFLAYRAGFSSYFIPNPLDALLPLFNNANAGDAINRMLLLCAKKQGIAVSITATHPLLNRELSINSAIWQQITS